MANELAVKKQRYQEIATLFEERRGEIVRALAGRMPPEFHTSVALALFREQSALLECDQNSLLGALLEAAHLGLSLDPKQGHLYLTAFENRKRGRKEAQLIIGYKGYIELARKNEILAFQSGVVYPGDEFHYEKGSHAELRHVPGARREGDQPTHAWAGATDVVWPPKGSGMTEPLKIFMFEVMTAAEIAKIAKKSGPWIEYRDRMWEKSPIRRLAARMALGPDLQRAAMLDELADAGISQHLGTRYTEEIEPPDDPPTAEATAGRTQELRDKKAPPLKRSTPAPAPAPPADTEDMYGQPFEEEGE